MNRLKHIPLLGLIFVAGCFPVELDVNDKGELLIPRQEGFFLFNPHTRQTTALTGPGDGAPVFARFAPGGKEALLVVKDAKMGGFRFDLMPLPKGEPRTVFRAQEAAYTLFSPDGAKLGVVRSSELRHKNFSGNLPELTIVSLKDSTDKLISDGVGVSFRWFADSKRLLVFQMEDIDEANNWIGHVVELDAATGKAKRLASAVTRQTICLELSPDNKHVLFTAMEAAGPAEALKSKGDMKLFQLKISDLSLRMIDNPVAASFARYSPSGKKIMMFGGSRMAVADADGKEPVIVAEDAMPQQGLDLSLPGWVDEQTIYYFTQHYSFGTDTKTQRMVIVKTDGSGRKQVQPHLDRGAQLLGKDLPNKAATEDPNAPWKLGRRSKDVFEEPFDQRSFSDRPDLKDITSISALACSPDGRLLAARYEGRFGIGVWDLKTGKQSARSDKIEADRVVFSPDSKTLIGIETGAGRMAVWDAGTLKELKAGSFSDKKDRFVKSLCIGVSKDGKFAYAVLDKELIQFDIDAGKATVLPNTVEFPNDACYVPALDLVAIAMGSYRGKEIQLHKPGQKEPFKKIALPLAPRSLAFSRNGKTMAVALDADRLWKQYSHVQLWDTDAWKERGVLPKDGNKETRYYSRLALSADGKYLAGLAEGHSVDMWDTKSLQRLRSIRTSTYSWDFAMTFSGDVNTLLLGTANRKLRIIDVEGGAKK